jgi:tetratricopeptide (TPR) repeat protein
VTGAAAEFFVSYTGADTAWAEWIADQLEAAGHPVILQAWDFRPGENFIARMNQALEQTDRVVAVLSPAYFGSAYASDEWTAALVRDQEGRDRLLPVRIAPCDLPPLLANRIYVDLVGLGEDAAAAKLLAGIAQGRAKPADRRPFPGRTGRRAGRSRFPGRWPEIFNAPARNPNFTGRRDLLKNLRQTLRTRRAGAVVQASAAYGLGGVGKTQLAVEYAHRFAADYDLIWWIPAEQPVAIPGHLAGLARRLGLAEPTDEREQLTLLFEELRRRERWLLIFDNATTPHDLNPYRPPAGGGHLLITSRNPAWTAIATPLPVQVLPRADAVAFLHTRANRPGDPAVDALAAALGDLPLALEQAGAYVEQARTSLGAYLQLLQDQGGELLRLGEPLDYQHTVATTWTLALDQIRSEVPAGEDLLTLCAFLAPDELPRPLLSEHTSELPSRLQQTAGNPFAYDQALTALGRYSLVTVTEHSLAVHRLVQTVVRQDLDEQAAWGWAGAAVRLILAAWPDRSWLPAAWPRCGQLLPHALAAVAHAEQFAVASEQTGALLNNAGVYLAGRVELTAARASFERALAIEEAAYGPDDPYVGRSLNHLGNALRSLGELPEAHIQFQRALTIYEAAYGPDHPEVARTLGNLALVVYDLGELPEARDQLERAIAILEATYGPYDPHVAPTLNNLGVVLRRLERLPEARAQLERALAIFEAAYGPDHPEVARTLDNLGVVLRQLGRQSEARAHHEQSLELFEAAYRRDHPEVARTLGNLGPVLAELGELAEARAQLERALAIFEKAYGPNHPQVANTLHSLGIVLRQLGKLPQAEACEQRAHAIRQQLGGLGGSEWSLAPRWSAWAT